MATKTELEFHEAANIFPLDEEHLDELAADIKANGQQVPIETLDGKVIDGRRRLMACNRAGVQPKIRAIVTHDPITYVVSLNIHRRHLDPSQLAMCSGRARSMYAKQAKERQRTGGGDRKSAKSVPVNLPEPIKGDARDAAGKAFGVSGKSVDRATKVLKQGVPELVKAVDEGKIAVSTAADIATKPEKEQREEVKARTSPPSAAPSTNGTNGKPKSKAQLREEKLEAENVPGKKPLGVALDHAAEAINCLIRIPKNDPLRKQAFEKVSFWLKRNL